MHPGQQGKASQRSGPAPPLARQQARYCGSVTDRPGAGLRRAGEGGHPFSRACICLSVWPVWACVWCVHWVGLERQRGAGQTRRSRRCEMRLAGRAEFVLFYLRRGYGWICAGRCGRYRTEEIYWFRVPWILLVSCSTSTAVLRFFLGSRARRNYLYIDTVRTKRRT